MFIVVDKKGDKYGIVDTATGLIKYYDLNEIWGLTHFNGVTIEGVDKRYKLTLLQRLNENTKSVFKATKNMFGTEVAITLKNSMVLMSNFYNRKINFVFTLYSAAYINDGISFDRWLPECCRGELYKKYILYFNIDGNEGYFGAYNSIAAAQRAIMIWYQSIDGYVVRV